MLTIHLTMVQRRNNMTTEERITFETKYLEILKKQINEGLELLSNTSIGDSSYKDLVVNINNANNIALQLDADIKELTKETTNEEVAQ